jgi:two-component system, cell cycle sensor histidine kinase and response regulator CckA
VSGSRHILLVEDNSAHAELALRALERCAGLTTEVVETIAEAEEKLGRQHIDLILADLRLPDGSALDLLGHPTPVVVQTSQGDEARAVLAMKGGALDYCVKSPEMYRDLPIIIERALNASLNLFERRKAERLLRDSDERFRQLASSIPEAFWLFDVAMGRVVYASPAWSSVYGDVPTTWSGRLELVHPGDVEPLRELAAAESQVFRIVQGDTVRWVEERRFWNPGLEGEPRRLSCLAVDVTRRRGLEESLRHAHKMEAIGRLAGGVAHDFNNMLTAILSSAHELAETGADAELCELIISASERASELTRNLLSYSRRAKTEKSPLDVHAMIRAAISLLKRALPRSIEIQTDLSAPDATVWGDRAQVQSAFLNLGLNARDASPDEGKIYFGSRVVILDESETKMAGFELVPGPYLEVIVRDSGEGMPESTLSRIFEPFFTTKGLDRGTGLGLAAVYATMLEHQGAITVRSQVGEGTEFTLLFPLFSGGTPLSIDSAGQKVPSGRGLVLLVDDQELALGAARRVLGRLGYEVVTAGDGEAAWQIFKTRQGELVAVVTDLAMPKLDGRELIERILAISPGFPCVLCSGYASESRGASPVPILQKPFVRLELAEAIQAAIAKGGRQT